jgi:hypothetical protein
VAAAATAAATVVVVAVVVVVVLLVVEAGVATAVAAAPAAAVPPAAATDAAVTLAAAKAAAVVLPSTAAAAIFFFSSSIHSVSMDFDPPRIVDFFRQSSCGLLGGVWPIYSSVHLLLLMIQHNCSCETLLAPQNKWQNTAKSALQKFSQANNCIINNGA